MDNLTEIDKLIPQEAAAYIGCRYDKILQMVRLKQIPHYRIGNRVFFSRKKLDKWINLKIEKESIEVSENCFTDTKSRALVSEDSAINWINPKELKGYERTPEITISFAHIYLSTASMEYLGNTEYVKIGFDEDGKFIIARYNDKDGSVPLTREGSAAKIKRFAVSRLLIHKFSIDMDGTISRCFPGEWDEDGEVLRFDIASQLKSVSTVTE